ncbi:MAG: adenylyltransferase/cytidyltransferase family protein [Clostridia bacterium]|nr:adenylyltransferase/cytidyltransferase family protein [Clostridia bacterium]
MHKNQIVGYTTGVYDLFHIGHLNLLKRAKEKCDYLIVGVSTDEVVKQYKNKIPVMNYKERSDIIRNIKYADKVVVQDNMDKFSAWTELKYNVIFHGDDWKGSPMYSEIEKKLNDVGVKIVYFPYTKGISSSILIKKISDNNGGQ